MRFSIRDLIWLTLVVSLILGWWLWWRSIPGPAARVDGTILLGGSPLSDGRVQFQSASGQIFGSTIAKGSFSVEQIPAGDFVVTIEGNGVSSRYGAAAASELKVSVREGMNQFNFELGR